MTLFLKEYYTERELAVVFANTGREAPETLDFIDRCDKEFNLGVVWVECVIDPLKGKGTRHKIVSYETAAREGEPYEAMIVKYGLPSIAYPHCTRELKEMPIHSYIKYELGWTDYETAIGIRADETHRINRRTAAKFKRVYPLTDLAPLTKPEVLAFWASQPFDLNLEEFEGNCDNCFKKSKQKLVKSIIKHPNRILWWDEMERKYANVRGNTVDATFFRENRSARDLMTIAREVLSGQQTLDALDEKETDCFCKSTDQ